MRYFGFSGVFANFTAGGAPSAFNIRASLSDAALRDRGAWVGSSPRITRRGGLTANLLHPFSRNMQTYVTWIYGLPDTMTADQLAGAITELRRRVDDGMSDLDSSWTNVQVQPWTVERNGAISWWQSNEAANTRTAESFATLSADEVENPIGPTTAQTTPGTILGTPPPGGTSQIEQITRALQVAAAIVIPVAVVGLIIVYVPARVMPWNWAIWEGKKPSLPEPERREPAAAAPASERRETLPPPPPPAYSAESDAEFAAAR